MTKEQMIKNYMDKLKLTREEAEELYNDDMSDRIGEEGEEMTKKAKNVKICNQSTTKKRSTPNKERKIDNEKLEILTMCAEVLRQNGITPTIENEIRIHFKTENSDFTLQLTRHTKKK
jgi:hypothetical protein